MTKKKTKLLIISIIIMTIGAAGSIFAFSSGVCSFGPGFSSPRFHHRPMPPFLQGEIGRFILWRLDQGAKDLELSTAQQTAYDQLRASLSESIETGIQKKVTLKALVHSQIEQDTIDVTALTRTAMTHIDQFSAMLNKNLTLFNTFYAALDADQQDQIKRKIKDRMKQHHEHYGSTVK